MDISKNFKMEEFVVSATASKHNIDNTPDEESMANIIRLVNEVLQPIRDDWQDAIIITSGYRCPQLNKLVGGVKTSQHLKGEAADFVTSNNRVVFHRIKRMIDKGQIRVGQLIDESNYKWIHISLEDDRHTNQILHL